MLIVNGKSVNSVREANKLTGEDILAFMKGQSRDDIEEFKAYCATPKYTNKDGEVKERATSHFDMTSWIVNKYAPELREVQKAKARTLLDEIADL